MRKVVYTKHVMNTEKLTQFVVKSRNKIKTLNAKRDSSANVLIAVALVLFVGFMVYNFVGSQLTQVASKSYSPTAITPIPTSTPTPTPVQ